MCKICFGFTTNVRLAGQDSKDTTYSKIKRKPESDVLMIELINARKVRIEFH